jgi:hypothetical protein
LKAKTFVQPIARGAWNPLDTNNCTVRALANATGMPMKDAEDLLAKYGRERNKGTWGFHSAYLEAGLSLIGVYGTTKQARNVYHYAVFGEKAPLRDSYASYLELNKKGCTLGRFIQENQEGSYIVLVKGHALALVDGEVIDSHPTSAAKSVTMAYKVK